MNKLSADKRKEILHMLVEGSSMRSISRVVGVSINTVTKLMVDAGTACEDFHEKNVTSISARQVECDEIWSFCYAIEKRVPHLKQPPDVAGSVWTWTALECDSRLIVSWMVSAERSADAAHEFITNVRSRLANRVQLTTDGLSHYLTAVDNAYGADIDYAQLVKMYRENRYNGARIEPVTGKPDCGNVSTSLMERHNLTTRMSLRRFSRNTNGYSKKIENHCHALALYFVWYNWCRIHHTLQTTPAVAAGLADDVKTLDWLLDLVDGKSN